MKLKNSYLLLAVMGIFLLISIGSVCASDISSDDTVGATDSGSEIILSNESSADDTTQKIDTEIESQGATFRDTDNKTIPVEVKANKTVIDVTDKNLTVSEGNTSLKFSYNNSQLTITDTLAVGNHSLIIKYLGNDLYNSSSKNIILSIFGNNTIQSPNSVDINSTEKGVIPLNITDGVHTKEVTGDFSATISYKEGNNTTTVPLAVAYENGNLTFGYTLPSNITSATLALVYTEGEEKISKNITLNRIFNAKIEVVNGVNEYQDGNFTFKFTDVDTNAPLAGKSISLYTVGNIRAGFSATTDDKGIATFKTKNLYEFDQTSGSFTMNPFEVGNHAVDISTSGAVKSTTLKTNLTIVKSTINIAIEEFEEYYGTKKNVTITVTNAKSKEPVSGIVLHLYMPQTSGKDFYFSTDSNGQSKIAVNQLVSGTYDVTVNNNDTKNINNKKASGKIVIKAIPVKLTVSVPSSMYYNTGNTATVKVTDKATGKVVPNAIVLVQIKTGSKTDSYIYQANAKGVVTVNYAPAAVGTHKIIVNTADSRYGASSAVTKSYTVKKAPASIAAPKVAAYYKDGKTFVIKLTNSKNKKAIYGAKLNIKIFISSTKYYNYNGQTGLDGKLKISLDTFKPGTYKVVVSKADSKNYTAAQKTSKFVIKKAPAKFTPVKLTAKKNTKTYFKVTVKNTKTKKVIKGVKVKIKVYTGKKTKTYTVKTNSKGIAQLNVKSLAVGTHKVVITSGNKYVVAKAAASKIVIKK
ncbi:Ig-like domain-containing protein [Methanobrevibacter sp.]